jgi:type II secretory pathway component PulF
LLGWTAASVVVTGGLVLWVAAGAVLVFVVPDYERAFADQGLELRAPMQWTLAAARWGRRYWYVPGLLVPMAVVLSWLLRHRATGSLLGWVWLAALLGVPLLLNLGISLALLLP